MELTLLGEFLCNMTSDIMSCHDGMMIALCVTAECSGRLHQGLSFATPLPPAFEHDVSSGTLTQVRCYALPGIWVCAMLCKCASSNWSNEVGDVSTCGRADPPSSYTENP